MTATITPITLRARLAYTYTDIYTVHSARRKYMTMVKCMRVYTIHMQHTTTIHVVATKDILLHSTVKYKRHTSLHHMYIPQVAARS